MCTLSSSSSSKVAVEGLQDVTFLIKGQYFQNNELHSMRIILGFIPSLALLNLRRSCHRREAGNFSRRLTAARPRVLVMDHQDSSVIMHETMVRRLIRQALLLPRREHGRLPRILTEELAATVTEGAENASPAFDCRSGYPCQPLSSRLADVLVEWGRAGECPIEDMHMEGVTQLTTITHLQQFTPRVQRLLSPPLPCCPCPDAPMDGIKSYCGVACCRCEAFSPAPFAPTRCLCTHLSHHHMGPPAQDEMMMLAHPAQGSAEGQEEEGSGVDGNGGLSPYACVVLEARELLEDMGPRAIMLCLGMRHTQGSVLHGVPPPLQWLIEAFDKPWLLQHQLSVGARALSKHAPRSVSSRYWGHCKGSEAEKNSHARLILQRLLRHSVWMNLHDFAGGRVLEIRVKEGYGARWALGPSGCEAEAGSYVPDAWPLVFRGFLEPQALDGHERGWVH